MIKPRSPTLQADSLPSEPPGKPTTTIAHFKYIYIFSQIIPPSPSPTESKRLLYTSVSLLLSRTQGYCYHLSKFHIYALVYCIVHVKVPERIYMFLKRAIVVVVFPGGSDGKESACNVGDLGLIT